ncbi:hypothetical protein DHX103_05670 [Planococcus sp. X10-3]|uniref:hypothetical protein n=1 Tax=Planococcus sp. X10-3 TaxID=3061240 RepID=UPI003BB1776A
MNTFRFVIITLAAVSVFIGYLFSRFTSIYKINGFELALEGVLLFGSITLGFFATCISILATFINTNIVQDIIRTIAFKIDFILIAAVTVSSGFFGIIFTVIFQILIENQSASANVMGWVAGVWSGLTFSYFSYLILFMIVALLIFLKTGESVEKRKPIPTRVTYDPFKKND